MVRAGGQRPSHLLLTCWICLITKALPGPSESQGEHCTTSDGRPGLCVVVKYCREAVASFPHQLPTVCYQKGPYPFACCPIPEVDPLSEVYLSNQPKFESSVHTRLEGSRTVNVYSSARETPRLATSTNSNQPRYSTFRSSRTEEVYRPPSREETLRTTKTRNHYPRETRYDPPRVETRTYYSREESSYHQPVYTRATETYHSTTEPRLQPSRSDTRNDYSTRKSRYTPPITPPTDDYYTGRQPQYESSVHTTKYVTEERHSESSRRDSGRPNRPTTARRGSSRTKHATNYPRYDPPRTETSRDRSTKPTYPDVTTTRQYYATDVPQYEKDTKETYPNLEASRSYHSTRETRVDSSRTDDGYNYGLSKDETDRRPSSSRIPHIEISKTEIRYYNPTPTDFPYVPINQDRKPATVSTPTKHSLPPQTRHEDLDGYDNPPSVEERPKPIHPTHSPSKDFTKYNTPPSNIPILSEAGCGEPILELFVAGGTESRPGDWPWMAAVYRKSPPGRSNKFICGGVLINRRHIVSAAHCYVYGNKTLPPSRFIVRLGAHDRETMGEDHLISRVRVHEGYVARFHDHDIAILYLMNAIPYTKLIQPVCLPGPELANEDFVGKKATVIGWGDASFGAGYSQVLNEVAVPVVSSRDCFAAYARLRSSSFPRGSMEQYICAGYPDGGKDACQGDSGGPLLVKGIEGRWVAIGIVSFGFRCAEPGFPGVYSRVAYYLSWIEKAIYNI